MKDIAIYGAGGFGRELACLIDRINKVDLTWNLIGFFDDGKATGERNDYGEVLGGWEALNNWKTPLSVVMSIGTPKTVVSLVNKISNQTIDYPNLIAPDVIFMDINSLTLGKGNILCSGCLISCNTHIGDFNSFNDFVSIGHDTEIGNFNAFMTATRVSGMASIGNYNYFGVNSCMIQGVKIGNNTTIAAGSTIMRRTKDGFTYMGVPASPWLIKR